MTLKSLTLMMASTLVLTACATTSPDLSDSTLDGRLGGELVSASDAGPFTQAQPDPMWWRLYDSPALDGLITDALENNNSLAQAEASLAQVRASLGEARSARLPSTELSAQGGYVEQPLSQGGYDGEQYGAGFSTSWQVDLFGRVRNAIRAARQDVVAAEAAHDAAAILVAGETARAWADYCAGTRLVSVGENNVALAEQSLDLTERLYDAGRGLRLDVVQAQSRLETSRAELPSLRASRDSAVFRLATLTGRTPSEMRAVIPACEAAPRLEGAIAIGDVSSLLARRPDVREAEARLAAASARVGVSVAQLYPSVTLGGSISSTAFDLGDVGDEDSLSISLGPLISWSFPNQSAARARMRQAEAGAQFALAGFDQTVLEALQETETALTVFAAERQRRQSLEVARDAAAEAARLARIRYQAGSESYIAVLDAERTLANAETALASSDAAAASSEVDVFMALGGRWTETGDQ
ncbi:efflux transporter outer membrane subunit [Oceanicaulis sp. LC35]|uniref:efflux transporter outer membrane subunit n=1 Tax=Oceanicaulis sp. LC35 TaxID=3349635 RepID=UPI003F8346C5